MGSGRICVGSRVGFYVFVWRHLSQSREGFWIFWGYSSRLEARISMWFLSGFASHFVRISCLCAAKFEGQCAVSRRDPVQWRSIFHAMATLEICTLFCGTNEVCVKKCHFCHFCLFGKISGFGTRFPPRFAIFLVLF